MTVPCGTPDVTGDSEDVWPSSTTSWVRPCKKSVIWLRVEFLMPQCSNFRSRREWDTLSDALEKSRRMASIWLELSTLLARSLTVSISCVPLDLYFGKPCCRSDKISCHPRRFKTLLYTVCSMTLPQTAVSEIGWQLPGFALSPFLKTGTMWAFFQSLGTKPFGHNGHWPKIGGGGCAPL